MKTLVFFLAFGLVLASARVVRSPRDNRCGSICPCPYNYNPICGTNGKTYDNNCLFNCDQGCDQRLRMAHGGECDGDQGFTVAY